MSIEVMRFNEGTWKRASNALDLCTALEDTMCDLIQKTGKNDIVPVFIDDEAKKQAMEYVGYLAAVIASLPTQEMAEDAKRKLNAMYGYSAMSGGYCDTDSVQPVPPCQMTENFRRKVDEWFERAD